MVPMARLQLLSRLKGDFTHTQTFTVIVTIAIPIKRGLKACERDRSERLRKVTIAIKRGLKALKTSGKVYDVVSYNCYPD